MDLIQIFKVLSDVLNNEIEEEELEEEEEEEEEEIMQKSQVHDMLKDIKEEEEFKKQTFRNEKMKDDEEYEEDKRDKFVLNDFTLENYLGRGKFGKVYAAKYNKTGEIFAAKISLNEISKESNELNADLSREIDLISKMNHPSIIKFIFFSPVNFKNKPKPVIITELAPNGSLSQLLNMKRNSTTDIDLNDTRKLIIIYGIAHAMSYLHSHNIIHRDLKPENILLDEFLFPKIADFGLSKTYNSKQSTSMSSSLNSLKGTPLYMSPEIWEKYEYSKSSDVYAFALIVYEIITNEIPFDGSNYIQIQLFILQQIRPDFKKEIPRTYKKLIELCWSQNPNDRPTFDQIIEQLQNNRGFITSSVNEKDFYKYIKFINDCNTTYNSSNSNFTINSLFKSKQFDKYKISIKHNKFDINVLKQFSRFHIMPFHEYIKLDKKSQKIIDSALDDSNIQFYVAKCLIEGHKGFPYNVEIGLKYLEKSISNGNKEAALYKCKILLKGKIIHQNIPKVKKITELYFKDNKSIYFLLYGLINLKEKKFKEAKENFIESIKYGNCESMYKLGKILYNMHNEKEGIKLIKKAIDCGYLPAMYKYWKISVTETKTEITKEEGLKYLKLSAKKDYPKSIYDYSMSFFNHELNESPIKIINYLEKAANKGHADSMYAYSNLLKYDQNNFTLSNDITEYIKKASEKGHIKSIYLYGLILFKTKVNKDLAFKLIQIAAENGNIEAAEKFGFMLEFGDGIYEDKKEAAKYLKIASDNGKSNAMVLYANKLTYGSGIPINKIEAVKYFKMAINEGNNSAIFMFANLIANDNSLGIDKSESIKYYQLAIDKGDSDAMFCYAEMLRQGIGTDINIKDSIKYYKMAIEKGNSYAMANYAYILAYGEGIPVNLNEAVKYLKMAIDKGNGYAMTLYADLMKEGNNLKEAIKYYKMAINKGDSDAMVRYALILENGDGIPKNTYEAIKYYKMAINAGNIDAMNIYAHMLRKGNGISVNNEEAIKYLKIAIDKGSLDAMIIYAEMLISGDGVSVNQEEGIKYFKIAIDKGSSNAMNNYAYCLENGKGVPINIKKAVKYYKMAIDKGNAAAMNNYALMLRTGDKIPMNKKESVKYFKMASDLGNSNAMNHLGEMLRNGEGITVNKEEAVKYFRMAAEKGNETAMSNIGEMLSTGDGIPINKEEAKKYFEMSIDKGELLGMLGYGNMLLDEDIEEASTYFNMFFDNYIDMKIEHPNDEIGGISNGYLVSMIKNLIELNHPFAMFNYARMLENGIGVPVNKEEAIEYYIMAANKGCEKAVHRYSLILDDSDEFKNIGQKRLTKIINGFKQPKKINRSRSLFTLKNIDSKIFTNLNEDCRHEVIKAENEEDINSICYVANSFIEGKNNFPQNINIGFKYVEKASLKKNISAIKMYLAILQKRNFVEKTIDKITYLLNEIPTIYYHSISKISLIKCILSQESYDINKETPIINYPLAKKLCKEASDIGNSEAMVIYGQLCLKMKKNKFGIIQTDYPKALHYFKLASQIGNGEGMARYGNLLEMGLGGIKTNPNEAFKYYNMSYKRKSPYGYACYGFALIRGLGGIRKDINKGFQLIKQACDYDNPFGFHFYALNLDFGIPEFLTINQNLALEYYIKAAEKGNMRSLFNLAITFSETDKKKEFKYHQKALEEGSIQSAYRIGCLLINGDEQLGIGPNKKEGYKYIKYAAEHGCNKSIRLAMHNFSNENDSFFNKTEIEKYSQIAVNIDDAIITFLYAKLLFDGNSFPRDIVKGAKYIKISADLGLEQSISFYAYLLEEGIGVVQNIKEAERYKKMLKKVD